MVWVVPAVLYSLATDAIVSTSGINFFWAESEPDALLVQLAEHGRSIVQKHGFSISIGGDAYNKPNVILFRYHNATHIQLIRQESGAPFYVYIGVQLNGKFHVSCSAPLQPVSSRNVHSAFHPPFRSLFPRTHIYLSLFKSLSKYQSLSL